MLHPSSPSPPAEIPASLSGRFFFPPGSILTPELKLRTLEDLARVKHEAELNRIREEKTSEQAAEREHLAKEREWRERLRREEAHRQKQREREREEALKGEKHWVRSGGVLTDINGRRDLKRTEEIRRLVEKEDAERRIIERWQSYERAWLNIISSTDKPVTFADMPWPLLTPPKSPDELRNPTKIAEFLFESLTLEKNTTTRRERLRTALLRWHPDKLGSVLARVPEDELSAVKDGIDAMVISLMKLQEAEKAR
ncbi:hypothetical protein A7U60_g6370 [Sanghuangporus baumii]|uniref:Uncharacterized protein n=1 Tax=Sanghuangporus baumii TaxID=108892 RepID=A0A9Q5N1U6_SANBA|nr:hypothetical protein A7U60_g6370 [Sanghuangporus baumii]